MSEWPLFDNTLVNSILFFSLFSDVCLLNDNDNDNDNILSDYNIQIYTTDLQ